MAIRFTRDCGHVFRFSGQDGCCSAHRPGLAYEQAFDAASLAAMKTRKGGRSIEIVITGTIYGAGNIGDEGILRGILRSISELELDCRVTVLSANPILTRNMHGVCAESIYPRPFVFRRLRSADLVVLGGGTLVAEELGLGFPVVHTAGLITSARLAGAKVFAWSIGANPISSRWGRSLVRMSYALVSSITTRDEESRQVLADLGVNPQKIHVASDAAFLVDAVPKAEARLLLSRFGITVGRRPLVGVSVLQEAWGHLGGYKQAIAATCDHVVERLGAEVVFIAHEPRECMDIIAIEDVIRRMRHGGIVIPNKLFDPAETMGMIGQLDLVIGMRLHVLLFAAAMGVPIVAISRAAKVDNLMKLMGLTAAGTVEDIRGDDLIEAIEVAWNNQDALGEQLRLRAGQLQERSRVSAQHFKNAIDAL